MGRISYVLCNPCRSHERVPRDHCFQYRCRLCVTIFRLWILKSRQEDNTGERLGRCTNRYVTKPPYITEINQWDGTLAFVESVQLLNAASKGVYRAGIPLIRNRASYDLPVSVLDGKGPEHFTN